MMHYKTNENGDARSSGVEELYNGLLSRLKHEDFDYFSKWYELLLLEAFHEASENKTGFIWMKSSQAREKRGVCFSGLVMSRTSVTADSKIHYTFERKKNHFNEGVPMNLIPLVTGDRVIVSCEGERVFNETTGDHKYFINPLSAHDTMVMALVRLILIFSFKSLKFLTK